MTYATTDWPASAPLSALINRVHCCAALELLRALPDESVDLVLTDPPYGVTEAQWDSGIDWRSQWPEFKRVLTPRGALVVLAFTADVLHDVRRGKKLRKERG